MESITVREAAKKWNISERKIQQYCAAGKIEGAEKFSGAWAIPANAVKPADIDKEVKNNDMVVSGRIPMPLVNTPFALGHGLDAVESIGDPELRKLALAEYYYFSGQAEKAAEQAELFLTNPDIALRVSACWIYGYANLATGHIQQARYALAEVQHTLGSMDENTPAETRALAACIGVSASVLLHLPLPEGLSCTAETLRLLPMGLRYFALYVQAHYAYLQEDYGGCVGMVETVLALQTEIYPIPSIYLHLVATMAYMLGSQVEQNTVYASYFACDTSCDVLQQFERNVFYCCCHCVYCVNGTDDYAPFICTFVVTNTNGFDVGNCCEVLPYFAFQTVFRKFFTQDCIGFANCFQSVSCDSTQTTNAQTGAGEGLSVNHTIGQTQCFTNGTNFIFEQHFQRFNQFELQVFRQTTYVVVRFYCFYCLCTGFDDIGVDCTLTQEFNTFQFSCFFFEYTDEFYADHFTFCFGISYTSQFVQETVNGINVYQKLRMDTHTHSIASGHAYSTVDENLRWAAEHGLELVALTDHAPGMKDTTGHAYFANLHVLPEKLHGVRLLRGIELNIMDFDGNVDMDEKVLSRLDFAIASLHVPCIAPGSRKENTRALLKVMENPYVDVIGHPGDPRYDVDFKEVFRQAKETGTLLEINNASLIPGGFRDGSQKNVKDILRMSMEEGVSVVLGSDAHFYTGIGDFSHALALLKEVGFPEELVLNTDPVRFLASWTIGAMVAHTSGIPLKVPIGVDRNEYGQDSFLPGVNTMTNVLQEAGYYQTLMVGSDANFGGRKPYFEQHGLDRTFDIFTAREVGIVPPGYFVFWGMEDMHLFDFAKQELTKIAEQEQPFNFTMLTVDTHRTNGYVCRKCIGLWGEQYENVISCSSKQVYDFVEWIKQQDFYENTTIIIAGDHVTMDEGYIERNVAEDYERTVYNCIINSPVETEYEKNREFVAADMFPTTLAAIGCEIKGDRLGLGTNLFSGKPTLVEEMGLEAFDIELTKTSDYYTKNFFFD